MKTAVYAGGNTGMQSDLRDGGFLDGAADEPDGQPLYCKADCGTGS